MGVTRTMLVTGAGGFLGRAVVAEAGARGHEVRRLVRRGAGEAVLDLASAAPESIDAALAGADAVIHLAGAMAGDAARHRRDTLDATQALLESVARSERRPRVVLASSVAVYAADPLLEGAEIDEATPVEDAPEGRDAYAAAKLAQERMARAAAEAKGFELCILRPGAIYGPGRTWNAHLGPVLGPVLLRLGREGQIPLVHVANCAEAFVLAAEASGSQTLNILDDDLPDRQRFLAAHGRSGWPRLVVPLDWRAVHRLARLLDPLPVGKPGLLRPATLRARMMPVGWSNARARAALGWFPRVGFEEGMAMALRGGGDV